MAIEKIVPRQIMQRWVDVPGCAGFGMGVLPVLGVEAFPPGQHPKGSFIRPELWHVRILTARGLRSYGFARAWIGPDLRMHVELSPGQERDEVLMNWPDPKERG